MNKDICVLCPLLPTAASYKKFLTRKCVAKLCVYFQQGSAKRIDAQRAFSALPGDCIKTYIAGKYLYIYLVMRSESTEFIQKITCDRILNILSLCPRAATTCDPEGITPLHYVLTMYSNLSTDDDITFAIIDASPSVVAQRDSLGETPLHKFISGGQKNTPINAAVLKALVSSCPSSVR
jgi:hypothetical protein